MSEEKIPASFEQEYSEKSYWKKLTDYARVAGKEVVEKSLWLYFAAQRPETPMWAKTVAYSALGYFILPTDAIPDLIPAVGFSDDLGAVVVAIATIASYINDDVKRQAANKMDNWFGKNSFQLESDS